MKKPKVIVITTGFSTFVPLLYVSEVADIKGVLDCGKSGKLKKYLFDKNIPYKVLTEQNQDLKKWIKDKEVTLIIVYKMPFLLKKEIFSIPEYGSLNIHPSLLPRYRGPNPWFWIYLNMETESGITIHRIDEKEDHGEILIQSGFKIPLGACLSDLQSIVETKSVSLLKEILPEIRTIKGRLQNTEYSDLRAYNPTNYNLLIDINKIEGLNLWHLLRGFPCIIPAIFPLRYKGKYAVQNFIFMTLPDVDIGKIKENNSVIHLYCKNGIIEVLKTK